MGMKHVIACDLDGTLAHYDYWRGVDHVGAPIVDVLLRVRRALAAGHEVWIFTARVSSSHGDAVHASAAIKQWCLTYVGQELPVTADKSGRFTEFWDDKAVGVTVNKGTGYPGNNGSAWYEFAP